MSVALIDGDIIAYRCAAAAEKNLYRVVNVNDDKDVLYEGYSKKEAKLVLADGYELQTIREVEPLQIAAYYARKTLTDMLERLGTTDYLIYLTGSDNFRKKINRITKYKGNRDRKEPPTHLKRLRDFLVQDYKAEIIDGMEADDQLGIMSKKIDDCIICSIDKDLDQIPGMHYDWVKDTYYPVTEPEAEYRFYLQMLMGDASDNILGIPGIGEVKAAKLLNHSEVADWPKVVVDEYRRFYGSGDGMEVCNQLGLTWQDVLLDHEMLIRIRTEPFDENNAGIDSVFSPYINRSSS